MTWILAASVLAEGGSVLTRDDWLVRAPLAAAVIAFVATVDAIVVVRILRARRKAA